MGEVWLEEARGPAEQGVVNGRDASLERKVERRNLKPCCAAPCGWE